MKEMLKKIFSYLGWDKLALIIVLAGLIWANLHYQYWKIQRFIIGHDVIFYYEYLPAAIIHKDLTMSFTKENPAYFKDKIWTNSTRLGKSVSKMTMGLAVLHTPFFLAAHSMAGPLGYPPDGYSEPYRIALIISSVFYTTLGLWLLIKLLRKYFARSAIAISILAIGLGTNLYFYTTIAPTMSHAYSFFLFAAFIYAIDCWVNKPSWGNSALIGLISGLIILVRPSNGIIVILFPLWQVDTVSALKSRLNLLVHKSLKLVLIVLIACLVFVPQIIYWKYVTGDYFYYSYGEERFFFNNPVFLKGLFSYRKGWLVYTPVMTFALIGIIVLFFRNRKFFWPIAVFTLLNLYIILSWWCWWYGGGFGQRALVESYAILSLPLTAFIKFISEKQLVLRISFLVLMTCLISLNIFQTRQYHKGIIHWDAMNRKTYWDSYIHTKPRPGLYDMVDKPDYNAALKGDR